MTETRACHFTLFRSGGRLVAPDAITLPGPMPMSRAQDAEVSGKTFEDRCARARIDVSRGAARVLGFAGIQPVALRSPVVVRN